MSARAFSVFALCLAASAAQADTWRKLATAPYDLNNKQDAIAFADAQVGWYGNGTGRVYGTRDGGEHWSVLWRHPGTYVRAMDFADTHTGFLGNVGPGYFPDVTDRQPLYMTRDGGKTWTAVSYDGPRVAGICAVDVLKNGERTIIHAGGRVGGPAAMLESQDGGATWHSKTMDGVTGMILDIRFLDAQTGFIAGASEADEGRAHARILKTADGGATWRSVFESPRAGDNNWKLSFPSARTGYATIISYQAPVSDARGYVVKTTDGGETWTPLAVTKNREWIPYGITFLDEERGFVGGSNGGYETRDGGRNWTDVSLGFSVNKMRVVVGPDGRRRVFTIGEDVRRGEINP